MSHEHSTHFDLPVGQVFRKVRIIDRLLTIYHLDLWKVRIASIVIQVLSVLSAVTGAYLVGAVITGVPVAELWPVIGLLLLFTITQFGLSNLNSYWSHVIAFRSLAEIRKALYRKLDELAPAYVIKQRSGDLARSALSDVNLLELYIAHTLPEFLQAIVVTPLALIFIGLIHWSLMIVLAPFLIAAVTVPDWFARRAEAQGKAHRESAGAMSADVIDYIQGMKEIVAFGAIKLSMSRLDASQQKYSDTYVAYESRSGMERGAGDALLAGGMFVTIALGGWLSIMGYMNIALYPVAAVLTAMAFSPVMHLLNIARQLSQTAAAADRVFGIMNTQPSVVDRVVSPPKGPIIPEVRFEDVRFRYDPKLPEVLKGVNLTVSPGETVALVGSSGAGKSTCTYLLLRLWDPTEGSVRIGGHDLRQFPQEYLRNMIAYVPQDVYLFNISVRENIRIGRSDATDAEVREAARRAFALDFIEALPDKWNTVLGERGETLSGGQRQRIAIARAFLKDAPILVMDEAVSSLDTESEVAVRRAMAEVSRDRTTIIVAHRPSTIRSADTVVMLDKGRVAESGKYDELIRAGGSFESLITGKTYGPVSAPLKIRV
ncbi:Transport ATP-binding protein CydCD [Methanosarcina horonobensis HB-1 = JCM 15518]|uniref:Transport ATP-binding protein CydCD n=1 Tax=Methanosarcina horonobensis HB-1 = JCM 15518 TaxID=1434110 RepID=A0A0E3WUI4_9EURY|nr:ABC transporter ATP-binding protein [Methanosarcina horonobensis]AKB78905.1 Transport ATP-binding protein CydCD [Methanosarcina horonobensis HB-1 = JCM 15518]